MTKFVKLKPNHTELDSAVYSSLPRQLRSVQGNYADYDWFVVEEHYEFRSDAELYRMVMTSWELKEDGKVHMYYVPELVGLELRRSIVSNRVTKLRDEKLLEGVMFRGKVFDTRPETYMRVTGAVLKAVRDPAFETVWITEDNSTVNLTSADILALGDAYAAFEGTMVLFARQLKDSVEASDVPEEFSITDGWPSLTFGEGETLTIIKDGAA